MLHQAYDCEIIIAPQVGYIRHVFILVTDEEFMVAAVAIFSGMPLRAKPRIFYACRFAAVRQLEGAGVR